LDYLNQDKELDLVRFVDFSVSLASWL